MVARSKGKRFAGPVEVRLGFYVSRWTGDGDNFEKLVLDSLEKGGVFGNDRQVMRCSWTIHEQLPERTTIWVDALELPEETR